MTQKAFLARAVWSLAFWSLASWSFVSCRLSEKQPFAESYLTPLQKRKTGRALQLVQTSEFLKAAALYDELALELKGKTPEILFLFNAGGSYRKAGDCARSALRYQSLLDRALNHPLFKIRGLLEISYSYECLGKLKAGRMALLDITRSARHLPPEIRLSVYPARMSLAFARFQQFDRADSFRTIALNGAMKLRLDYSDEKSLKEGLSRLFFSMGRIYDQKESLETKAFISVFPYHQLYLLQSVFLKGEGWSSKSQREMEKAFKFLRRSLKTTALSAQMKEYVSLSLKEGKLLTEREKDPSLILFYSKLAQEIERAL